MNYALPNLQSNRTDSWNTS